MINNTIEFKTNHPITYQHYIDIHRQLYSTKPWKKGPYTINQININAEWDTRLKLKRLQRCLPDIQNKRILDIGCNNGFFLFASHALGAELSVGLDPSFRPYFQYLQLKSLIPTNNQIKYYWLGIEQMSMLDLNINTYFLMGILYHRSSSKDCLNMLYETMGVGDILILDTIVLKTTKKDCLHPIDRYQKMNGVYEIPSVPLLCDWLTDEGFTIEYIDPIEKTTPNEQRATYLGVSQSLPSFLDPSTAEKTIEGYPAPYRVMMRIIKK